MKKFMLVLFALAYLAAAPFGFAGCLHLGKLLSEHGAPVGVVNGTCCLSVVFVPGIAVDAVIIKACN